MSVKISINGAVERYGVTQKTIHRWAIKYEVHQFNDGTYDQDQLDALIDNYENLEYIDVNWKKANCKDLPTDFFYRIEDRGVSKLVDVDVFRSVCAPCPIWKQCLGYAFHNERYGVWGGMTSEERQAVMNQRKSSIKDKVFTDFDRHGITKDMIREAIGRK